MTVRHSHFRLSLIGMRMYKCCGQSVGAARGSTVLNSGRQPDGNSAVYLAFLVLGRQTVYQPCSAIPPERLHVSRAAGPVLVGTMDSWARLQRENLERGGHIAFKVALAHRSMMVNQQVASWA